MSVWKKPSFLRDRERRYRTLWVTPEWMIHRLVATRKGDRIFFADIGELPPGFDVESVCWSEERRCFGFRLWHSDFDVVPIGDVVPDISANITGYVVDVLELKKLLPNLALLDDVNADAPVVTEE